MRVDQTRTTTARCVSTSAKVTSPSPLVRKSVRVRARPNPIQVHQRRRRGGKGGIWREEKGLRVVKRFALGSEQVDKAPDFVPASDDGAKETQRWRVLPERGVTAPQGFQSSGVCAGLRSSGSKRPDLALVYCPDGAQAAAGVFTQNLVCAAPVTYCKQVLEKSRSKEGEKISSVLINAGQANAATGMGQLINDDFFLPSSSFIFFSCCLYPCPCLA